ncbi:MAG: DUF2090 domain-containing protein [Pseudomonadota bacterium]
MGRTIFAQASVQWLSGQLSDDALVTQVASGYADLIDAWEQSTRQ